ncbi:GPW_gp25 domain-containing protein [Rubrivivax sp. A210]|uniref:GPW/gp25 family protein n=1 Tax=Rubrivivax sp. A210 TaxID=2772301 RepID=UPI0019A9D8EB|nr:GPW/gp25 family protein [Rubrivivax sp. A210]CAD5367083.1 GPW_gp25 domain-containing protein [Rubrivivax sp. A210]
MNIAFPYRVGSAGRSAAASGDEHVRQMIEQLLFTTPGERVNRPDLGSDLMQLVFAPNSTELAAALRFTAQGCLQRWLGDVIDVLAFEVESDEATLVVNVQYRIKRTGAAGTVQFQRQA